MKRLECLDGLRGVLAVYVMLGHMAPFSALPDWITHPLSHGGAAVDVFFILSGLVIIRSLESCRFAARPFLISRVARIFPVFLVMFAIGIAVQPLPVPFAAMPWIKSDSLALDIWSQGWPVHWIAEISAHLTMTHGLFPNGVLPDVWVSFLGAAWSLSTEWQFYVLALLLGRSRIGVERLAAVFLVLTAEQSAVLCVGHRERKVG
jgi:peptidoglycan/LPS O-acetylase OafA/YrhL